MNRKVKCFLTVLLGFCGLSFASVQDMVDSKATKETKALYENLKKLQQQKSILFGHQDDTAYGIAWMGEKEQSDVKKVTGDYPAVYGWDLGHIETGDSLNIDKVPFDQIRQLILEAYARGGVNTISWHLQNPYTGGSSWDVSSDKVVSSILPGGQKHTTYLQWLDKLADFIYSLKTKDGVSVPLLFRPFHEHTGSWFWWGNDLCTKNEYISLWQFTIDYLRNKKKLHNLIYIYSPDFIASKDDYFERYPSDKYVDVLGLDLYHREGETKAEEFVANVKRIMKILNDYSEKSCKPYVFSETGSLELPMENWFTEVLYKALNPNKPVYVLVWRNAYDIPRHYYAPYPGHPAGNNLKKFMALPDVLFESELPDMYKLKVGYETKHEFY